MLFFVFLAAALDEVVHIAFVFFFDEERIVFVIVLVGAVLAQIDVFDAGGFTAQDISRMTADMWADLLWDRDTQARLKRDGLTIDALNLGGACPYRFAPGENGHVIVTLAPTDQAATLIDLWRVHFLRGILPRSQTTKP